METAQLGSMPNISLGGYIPTAQRQPKLWESVLAQFVGGMAGQAGGAIVDRATSPDMTAAAKQLGVDAPSPSGIKRGANAAEIRSLSEAGSTKKGTEANIAQGEAGLDIRRGGLMLDVANAKDAETHRVAADKVATEHLQLLKEQLANAKTDSERKNILELAKFFSDAKLEDRKVGVQEQLVPSEIEKNKGIASGAAAGVARTGAQTQLTAEQVKQARMINEALKQAGLSPQDLQ